MSKKRNPLFVDSTKFNGDLVSMQIEIKAQTLVSGAQLRMEVFRRNEVPAVIPLLKTTHSNPQSEAEAYWAGQIQLEHMEPFSYQIVLSSSEGLDIRGPQKEGLGGYILLDTWTDPLILIPDILNEAPVLALPTSGALPMNPFSEENLPRFSEEGAGKERPRLDDSYFSGAEK